MSYGMWAPVVAALLMVSCSSQDPSFTEDQSQRTINTDDALGKKGNGEPLDADQMASAGQDGAAEGGVDGVADGASDAMSDGGGDATDSSGAGADGAVGGDAGADGGGDGVGADSGAGGSDAGADSGMSDGAADGNGQDGGYEGPLGARREMAMTQQGPGKVDILWVVDTSGSMSEEQQYLSQNFNVLVNELVASGHDFQTAITTTDICQNQIPSDLAERVCPVDYGGSSATHLRGRFVGEAGHRVLKSSDSDLVSRFNSYVSQGTDGSGFEHGLKAAQMAVERSLNGQNEALVRNDAFLAVIVVSDEEDDGIGLSKTDAYHGYNFWAEDLTRFKFTEDDMIGYLRNVKGEGHFSVSAIAPTRSSDGQLCSAPHSQPKEEGTQYIKAANKTGGLLQSICATNWSSSLSKIGVDLTAQITQVVLPSPPIVATIRVYVENELRAGWTYNAGNNAIKFTAGNVPAEGQQIRVVYNEYP